MQNYCKHKMNLAIIILKSGTLKLQDCSLSVETIHKNVIYQYKLPCLHIYPNATAYISRC